MHHQVVIIGGGISGLTCAYRLQQMGLDVLLIEREERPGGVIQSKLRDGYLTEAGPNSFQNTPDLMRLIEELGLTEQFVTAPSPAPRYIYYAGALHDIPMNPSRFLSTPLLSVSDKLKVFLEPFARRPPKGEESVAEFIKRRFGERVLELFVAPFVSGVYAGDPHHLSVRSALPMLKELEEKHGSVLKGFIQSRRSAPKPRPKRLLCSFRPGLGALPQRLAERLGPRVMTCAEAISLHPIDPTASPRFRIEIMQHLQADTVQAEAIVLATPAHTAACLVRSFSQKLADVLASIAYPPLVVVCLGYDRSAFPRSLEGFGFLVPRNQGLRLLGCIWSSSLFAGRAPEGGVCLTNFLGGTTDADISELDDDAVIELVHGELQSVLGVRSTPYPVAVHRYMRSIPQYDLGHETKRQLIEAELRTFPGLFLVGNYLSGVSVGDCVLGATGTAESVLRFCSLQHD